MIYSASRRTDLVAWFPEHIINKVLRSRKLEAIAFWTKDPRNLITNKSLNRILIQTPSIIQLTITGLGGTYWEPDVPAPSRLASCLKSLAAILPPGSIQWRFDPIIVNSTLWQRFDQTLNLLSQATDSIREVTVSFPDPYPEVIKRLKQDERSLPTVTFSEQQDIVKEMIKHSGLRVNTCCEPTLLKIDGVHKAACVNAALFEKIYDIKLSNHKKDYGQRKNCGCTQSTDIGSYQMVCKHNCRYCYACPQK